MFYGRAFQQHSKYVLCGCYWFFKSFNRTSYVRRPNYTLGRIIRNQNKENKTLFGKLVETRKERRKTIQNNSCSSSGDVQINSQSVYPKTDEIFNNTLKSSTEFWPRTEVRFIKASNCDCEDSVTQETNRNVHDNAKFLVEKYASSTVDVNEPKGDFKLFNNDNIVTGNSSPVLPPVILKNINKFPMMNQNKSVLTTYSLKTFDSSCISNKQISRIYPSVSRILNATMSDHSKMLLKKWREKMVAELGQEGFMKFYKAQLNAGSQFHTAIQSFLRGTPAEDLLLDGQGVEGCWRSLAPVILKMEEVHVLEGPVCHSDLLYHGVMDCVAVYQGKPVLIEWKKSEKPKPTIQKTYDAPIQMSAYMGAMNFDKNYPIEIKGGMVVVAYSDGSTAETFHLDLPECYAYWKLWLQRLQSFWNQHYERQSVSKKSQEIKEM